MTPASVAEGVGFAGVDTLAVALVEEDDNVDEEAEDDPFSSSILLSGLRPPSTSLQTLGLSTKADLENVEAEEFMVISKLLPPGARRHPG